MEQIEQEINIRELIYTIVEKKWLVIAVFLISVIPAILISLAMPHIYELSMFLEPTFIDMTDQGQYLKIDAPQNIRAKIQENTYNLKVIHALNLDPDQAKLRFDVSQPAGSNLVKISMREKADNVEMGIKILHALYAELLNDYKGIIDYKKGIFEKQIIATSAFIAAKKKSITMFEQELISLKNRENALDIDLKDAKAGFRKILENSDRLISEKDNLSTSNVGDNFFELYSNVLVSNIQCIDSLNSHLAETGKEKIKTLAAMVDLDEEINDLQLQMEEARFKKESIQNIKLLQEPEVSLLPVGPNKTKNVAIAGGAGLIFGIFLVFFMKFWEGYKRK
ncbi:MAG: hypothetical protein ISS26_01400 [Candidatus Omnitrophica bacterium]|nr:hypothetical protein [Candidatus Omnitrophota bacterium]